MEILIASIAFSALLRCSKSTAKLCNKSSKRNIKIAFFCRFRNVCHSPVAESFVFFIKGSKWPTSMEVKSTYAKRKTIAVNFMCSLSTRPAISIAMAERNNLALNNPMNHATKICGRLPDAFSSRKCTMSDKAIRKTSVGHTIKGVVPYAMYPAAYVPIPVMMTEMIKFR